jgi:capsular exopolysaccharide synthesis family protein
VFQLQQQLQGLRQQLHTAVPLTMLQGATASPLLPSGLQAPSTRAGRVALGALAGLLAGIVLALVLERFDTKIRTRDEAEDRFGVPVLAEIPRLPRADRRLVTTAARPTSPAADAFRLIAAAVSRATNEQRSSQDVDRGTIILVTSSGPSEGKTTVVANLAAVFAEVGRSVLILSCDLRRPQIHRLFGVDHAPGLTDALGSQNGRPLLEGRMVPTTVPNVSLVPSGTVNDVPAGLLGSDQMRRVLAEARSKADIVLMDTAPILVASEVAPLVGDVDAVIVVAEAGRTTTDVAGRTTDLLNRLGAPVVGVVLNRAGEITIPRGYYRYYSIPKQPTPVSAQNGSGLTTHTEGSPEVDTASEAGEEALDR